MTNLFRVGFIVALVVALVSARPSERIVGGADATEGQFPHQISLRRNGAHTCGGSIISRNYILTAAHCVAGSTADVFTIRAGSKSRLTGGVLVNVVEIKMHEDYNGLDNDVCLLRLESPLIYSKNIQPISIASGEVPNGAEIIISGWGRVSGEGDVPNTLKWNTLKALSKSQCSSSGGIASDTLLCLAHAENNGACFGDSGGPAVYKGQVVGIAGFVIGGCGSKNPDGYAKVYAHREWIKKNCDI